MKYIRFCNFFVSATRRESLSYIDAIVSSARFLCSNRVFSARRTFVVMIIYQLHRRVRIGKLTDALCSSGCNKTKIVETCTQTHKI